MMTVTLDVSNQNERINSIKKLMVGRGNNNPSLLLHEESKYTQCTILNINAETDFAYYISSRSLFEDTIVRDVHKKSGSVGYKGKVARTLLDNKILQDTNFSLYKNLLYKEVNPKIMDKIHIELNFYNEIPKVLYHTKDTAFDQEKFDAQYTKVELFIMYDLLNALVLDIIDSREVIMLQMLLLKDPILGEINDDIIETVIKSPATVITELMGVITVTDVHKPSYKSVLSQYLSQLMLPIVTQIYKGITGLQGTVVFKSISDFRYILTTSDIKCTEFMVIIPDYTSSLTGKSYKGITVSPKMYVEDEYIRMVKSLMI